MINEIRGLTNLNILKVLFVVQRLISFKLSSEILISDLSIQCPRWNGWFGQNVVTKCPMRFESNFERFH